MSNKDVCKRLQELIDAMSDTELAEYIPAVTAAKDMLTPKSPSKKASPITGQISLDEVLASYYKEFDRKPMNFSSLDECR